MQVQRVLFGWQHPHLLCQTLVQCMVTVIQRRTPPITALSCAQWQYMVTKCLQDVGFFISAIHEPTPGSVLHMGRFGNAVGKPKNALWSWARAGSSRSCESSSTGSPSQGDQKFALRGWGQWLGSPRLTQKLLGGRWHQHCPKGGGGGGGDGLIFQPPCFILILVGSMQILPATRSAVGWHDTPTNG